MKARISILLVLIMVLCLFAYSSAFTGAPADSLNFSLYPRTRSLPQDYRPSMLAYYYPAEKAITGEGVTIAVIDSGLWEDFTDHSSATIMPGVNYLAEPESADRSNTNDTYGHGTFVTSIICGDDIGLAPDVTIVPLKCFDEEISDAAYVAEAVRDAVDVYDCDIINLSLGDTVEYPELTEAVQYALGRGVIVIAASGNTNLSGSNGNDAFRYPAAQNGVISVSAVDPSKSVWYRAVQNSAVTVAAPGVDALGLSLATGGFVTNDGTSFAAPIVTATAALAQSADPSLSRENFIALLAETSEDLGTSGRDNSYGYGLINPALLLAKVLEDDGSLIISSYDDKTCVSANLPDSGQSVIAFYNDTGSMISAGLPAGAILSNYEFPDGTDIVKVFCVEQDTYRPLSAVRVYNAH